MQLSARGERALMNEEGSERNDKGLHIPYKCAAGRWTLGYGEVIAGQDVIKFKHGITEEVAVERFRKKVAGFVAEINKAIRVPVTQNQFDVCVSFAYNVGLEAFRKSTFLKMINNRQYVNAADQLLRWNKINGNEVCEGLTNRRRREKELFLKKEQ